MLLNSSKLVSLVSAEEGATKESSGEPVAGEDALAAGPVAAVVVVVVVVVVSAPVAAVAVVAALRVASENDDVPSRTMRLSDRITLSPNELSSCFGGVLAAVVECGAGASPGLLLVGRIASGSGPISPSYPSSDDPAMGASRCESFG